SRFTAGACWPLSVSVTRITLIGVNLFAALSAFAGALGLVVGFMDIPLDVLRTTPFADFTVPALLLAAALILWFGLRRIALFEPLRFAALASAVAGGSMVGWIIVEVAMIGFGGWLQTLYFAVGLVMIGLAALLQWAETDETRVTSLHHP